MSNTIYVLKLTDNVNISVVFVEREKVIKIVNDLSSYTSYVGHDCPPDYLKNCVLAYIQCLKQQIAESIVPEYKMEKVLPDLGFVKI